MTGFPMEPRIKPASRAARRAVIYGNSGSKAITGFVARLNGILIILP